MAERNKGFLSEYVAERANLLDLILVTIFIAFGIDLTANSFVGTSISYVNLSFGLGICFLAIVYLIIRILVKRIKIKVIEGFFIYDKKANSIIYIPRYELSEYLVHYFISAFSENPALKVIWDREKPLKKDLWFENKPQSSQLVVEAIEYFILDNLCTHLTDYYAEEKFKSETLDTITREQIPNSMLNNRFLELFSRPMENRHAFVKETLENENADNIYLSDGKHGELYSRFELSLPQNSKLVRINNNTFEIRTQKLNLTINTLFEGYSHVLPFGFDKYYLGINTLSERFDVLKFCVNIKIQFKLGILFAAKGKEYYQWIDSFLDEIDTKISGDRFFKLIEWDSALTTIECIKRLLPITEISKEKKEN